MSEQQRQTGVVAAWNGKGYGFLSVVGRLKQVFVHRSELPDGGYELVVGETVSFLMADSPKGPRATAVILERDTTT
jgi:cold shock CspA family protein